MTEDPFALTLQAQLEWHVDAQHVPGAVAAVTVPGKGRFAVTAGFEDLQRTRKMRTDGRFMIYSITKIFISVTILRLCQNKALALDDHVSYWCPEIDVVDAISIRQLLNHTSGLPDYGNLATYRRAVEQESREPWSFDEFLKQTCERGLVFEPGTGGAYSNIGYMLLTRIIERAARKSFADVLRIEVLSPLRLSLISLVSTPDDLKSLVSGYSQIKGNGEMRDIREWYHPGWVAHGVLAAPVDEVNRLLEALFEGRLLDPQYLSEMLQMVPIPDFPPKLRAGYGLGIASETDASLGTHYGHEGGGPGYRLVTSHAPKLRGTTITVFCNRDECNPRTISDSLLHTVFQSL